MLEREGHRVQLVVDGEAALEALERQRFDLVFMDMQMPTLDGLAATRRIRLAERGSRRTPICALTASAMQTDVVRCREAGMDGFLSKPVDLVALRRAMRSLLAPVRVEAA
jgi:CheY-like chemotaxis protein